MLRAKSGRIINITSVSGQAGQMGQANYSSAKAGLIGLTKAAARELGSRGITVNAVAPGFVLTELTQGLAEEWKARIIEQTPLGRFGTVEEVAYAVAFLASDEAAYITGQVLAVDGGLVMISATRAAGSGWIVLEDAMFRVDVVVRWLRGSGADLHPSVSERVLQWRQELHAPEPLAGHGSIEQLSRRTRPPATLSVT
jgi:hypothetical protein